MAYTPVKHDPRPCRQCGELFIPRMSHAQFCRKACYKLHGKAHKGHSNGNRERQQQRQNLARRPYTAHKGPVCECCGFVPEHPCQLDVDHVDGNHTNNDPSNLQTLCANCHRLKTYRNRDWQK